MRKCVLGILGIVLVMHPTAPGSEGQDEKGPPRPPKVLPKKRDWAKIPYDPLRKKDAIAALKDSTDRDNLLKASLSLCRDPDPEAIPALLEFLKNKDFLNRLDAKDDYDREDTRLEAILFEIVQNSGPAAGRRILSLRDAPVYRQERFFALVDRAWDAARKPRDLLVRSIDLQVALSALATSKDPNYLFQAAISLCRDQNPEAIPRLVRFLKSPDFLARLERGDAFRRPSKLEQITWEMAKYSGAATEERLLQLAGDALYQDVPHGGPGYDRRLAILEAASLVRNPSEKILSYLDLLMKPGTSEVTFVVEALVKMRSVQAAKLVEKYVLSPKFDTADKLGWLDECFECRDDPGILAIYRQLLKTKVDDETLRERIVVTLFSRRTPRGMERPPPAAKPWTEVSTESLQEFLKLVQPALEFGISDATKSKVETARKEIEEVLAKRMSEKK